MTVGETPVTIVGTVVSEVALKRVGDNEHELATFLLRASERKYDKEKSGWYDHRHFYIRIKCWRKLAATVHGVLRRGDPVIVAGRLFVSDFESADGQPRSVPEIEAWAIGPNLMLCKATVERAQTAAETAWSPPAAVRDEPRVREGEPVRAA